MLSSYLFLWITCQQMQPSANILKFYFKIMIAELAKKKEVIIYDR